MGVDLGLLAVKQPASMEEFQGKKIVFDTNNMLYQFLSNIRSRDGEPLTDSSGRITSHLTGLFYRTANLLEKDIKPIFVFDGKPSKLKKETLKKRNLSRTTAEKKHREFLEKGMLEEAKKYAAMSSKLTKEMVLDAKQLLNLLGLPVIQSPGEGEAQAAQIVMEKKAEFVSSQDYDALLFGAPKLVRNLAFSGKRKLPGRNIYVDVSIETINLSQTLEKLGINRKKLVWLSMLIGTDFNQKISGIGPKTALKLVKKHDDFKELLKETKKSIDFDFREIEKVFLNPRVEKEVKIRFENPDKKKIISFLCNERDFSEERVKTTLERITASLSRKGVQSRLMQWS